MKKVIYIGLAVFFLIGCERLGFKLDKPGEQEVKDQLAPASILKGRTDPLWNSYGCTLPLVAFSYSDADTTVERDLSAPIKTALGNRAFMSTNRYAIEAVNLLVSRPLDESGITSGEPPDPAQLPVGEPGAVWKAPLTITAGPIACSNAIIVASSEPAIILLEPDTLRVIKSFPVENLILAFTGFNPETFELSVLHGDLSVGTYLFLNEEKRKTEAVDQLIGPGEEALKKIQEKTAALLSAMGPIQFDRTRIYPVASAIEMGRENLFRLSVDADGTYRIYLDGIGAIPFLFILFNEEGESIFSNVGYEAEKVLEQPLTKGAVYYLVVSLFHENQEDQVVHDSLPRLVVKQK